MLNCTIQYLEKTKDGWHIRFGGEDFWLMLSKFKAEQKISGRFSCYFDPRLFGKGGWFCVEDVLIKYAGDFTNYAEKRKQAEREWKTQNDYKQESFWDETKQRDDEAFQRKWEETQKRKEEEIRRRREQAQQQRQQWEETQRRQEREQHESKPPVKTSTSLTISQALQILELPAPASRLTEKQVKSAFHQKALKHHPDVNKAPDAHTQMVQLNKAYQLVLIYCQKAPVG